MVTSKTRKHSGRKTYYVGDKNYQFQKTFWDDWTDHRDGLRNKKSKKELEKIKKSKIKRKTIKQKFLEKIMTKIKNPIAFFNP